MVLRERPRVLMIISLFPPFLGGAERQALTLATHLVKRGIKVSILTRSFPHLPLYECIDGVEVYRKIKTIDWKMLFGITYLLSVLVFLLRYRGEFDIIHCHVVGFHAVVAVFFKYLFGKKVIVKMSSSGDTSDLKILKKVKLGGLFLRWVRHVDAIVSLCKRASEEIVHQGFSQAILVEIPNGVDLSQFSVRPAQRREGVPHLTYIGRLDKYKGVTFLLKGFKELLSRAGAVRLTIVGDGPDEFLLKAMAREIDIDERVTFRGRQEEVLSEYHRTTIFVLPSLSEGMSNVLLEAMACGLPVVATSVGGNSDIITDRHNGLLVPPGDALTLSTALLELLENDDFAQRLGEAARKTVELNYAMERIVERYLALYSRLGS